MARADKTANSQVNPLVYVMRKLFRPRQIRFSDGLLVEVGRHLPAGIRKALYKERYEGHERNLVQSVLKPGDRVLDIGSGIGIVAATCASICGSDNVLCYEANPKTVDLIRRNFALNGWQVNLQEKAMATHEGSVSFFLNDNILSSSTIDRNFGGETEIPCDDLARVVTDYQPDVIVMDVEGAEVDLLPHADLSDVDKLLVELHPHILGEEPIQELVAYLSSKGFVEQEHMRGGSVAYFQRQG